MKFSKGWTFTGTQGKSCGYTEETNKTIRNWIWIFGFAFFNSRQFVESLTDSSSIPQGASQSSVTNILSLPLVVLEQKNRIRDKERE